MFNTFTGLEPLNVVRVFCALESVLLTLAWLPRPGDLDMKWVVDFFNPVASLAFGTFGNKHVGVSPFPGFVWSQRVKCAAITLWLYKWCCRCSFGYQDSDSWYMPEL